MGSVIVSGSTIYGMGHQGGIAEPGFPAAAAAFFRLNTTGGRQAAVFTFTGSNGAAPTGSLILSGTTLYGMTSAGGANGDGNIFSIGIDGGNFQNLYQFTGGTDGSNPRGSLILVGTTLYGMTPGGGPTATATFFRSATTGGVIQTCSRSAAARRRGEPLWQFDPQRLDPVWDDLQRRHCGDGVVFALSSTARTSPRANQWAVDVNGSGTWSVGSNWDVGVAPGSNAQDTAVFGTVLTSGTAIVNLDSSRSLSSLGFSTTAGQQLRDQPDKRQHADPGESSHGAATLSDSGSNHRSPRPSCWAAT